LLLQVVVALVEPPQLAVVLGAVRVVHVQHLHQLVVMERLKAQ
jgi:hypothetical protein